MNRRLFMQLLSLLPFLRKLMEPAPEVVQPMRDPRTQLITGGCKKGKSLTESLVVHNKIKFFLHCLPPQLNVTEMHISPLIFLRLIYEAKQLHYPRSIYSWMGTDSSIPVCNVNVFQARPDEMPYLITAAGQKMGIAL